MNVYIENKDIIFFSRIILVSVKKLLLLFIWMP